MRARRLCALLLAALLCLTGCGSLNFTSAEPIEVVDFALYLASEKGAFITGTNHVIDGGRLSVSY